MMNFMSIGGMKNYKINLNIMKNKLEKATVIVNTIKSRLGERVIMILLLLVVGFLLYKGQVRKDKFKAELQQEKNLSTALADSINTYSNRNGELVIEKRTLQTDLRRLEDGNFDLTQNQERLVDLVNEKEKENSVLAAAVAEGGILIDSLNSELGELNVIANNSNVTIDDAGSDVNFKNNSDVDFQFDITINNVKSIPSLEPQLNFNSINFPNTQEISFQWEDNRREGFPITFNISNSNRFYKTLNIDSYAIPELNKQDLKRSTFGKVWDFLKGNGKYIAVGGVGYLLGNAIGK